MNLLYLPSLLDSFVAVALYALLAYILIIGFWQFFKYRIRKPPPDGKMRSLILLGAVALVVGIIGFFKGQKEAFKTIEVAGDISPALIAHSLAGIYDYIILGLVCLAITFMFKYVNSQP